MILFTTAYGMFRLEDGYDAAQQMLAGCIELTAARSQAVPGQPHADTRIVAIESKFGIPYVYELLPSSESFAEVIDR